MDSDGSESVSTDIEPTIAPAAHVFIIVEHDARAKCIGVHGFTDHAAAKILFDRLVAQIGHDPATDRIENDYFHYRHPAEIGSIRLLELPVYAAAPAEDDYWCHAYMPL